MSIAFMSSTWIAAGAAAVLWLAALRMNAAWFNRHILPDFFVARQTQWQVAFAARIAFGLAGLLLIALAARLRRGLSAHMRLMAVMTLVAASAAIVTSEIVLRNLKWQSFQALDMRREPLRAPDARLGWRHVAHHSGTDWIGGRRVSYTFDGHGYRVEAPSAEVDPNRPTILFTGESVMTGFGLDWKETVPALVQDRLGIQAANLAVTGFSTDQSFMRLRDELPKFRCPVAVVSIFMPAFLDRNINSDRPHLDDRLNWHPVHVGWRLAALARHALAYRNASEVDAGIAMTTAALRGTNVLAHARGARSVILVPAFMPESPVERGIRQRVLDKAGLDYLFVPLKEQWRIAGDDHPDARGASAMASVIVDSLQRAMPIERKDREPCNSS